MILASAFTDASPLGCWPRRLRHSEPVTTCLAYIHLYIYIHSYQARHRLQCPSWGPPRFWSCFAGLVLAPARDALPGTGLPPAPVRQLWVCGVVPTVGCFWPLCFCVRSQWPFFSIAMKAKSFLVEPR